ncbi:alkaline phosphatase family protein [Pseudodesulfovibrio sp. zrk46]|uniref:alkaline phosphatase family protein n=1 Tax=Pseudodesulfovibrio sp. zrk46 TaxID=2725288 RepID=UPI001448F006|nr:alkaline phosphatase family protein [Pseudodesulfovibrio sp. zrk46]QJB57838.1 phosphodiesterase [Pseudodesulfovibrio sp. zrk46]
MSLLLAPTQSKKRLVVLGLDGLPLELARSLGRSLPNIGRLAEHATTVCAEIPELSPVNWTSFFTGKGPETHGTFGFSRIDTETYELSITNSNHIDCPTIFDWLNQSKLVSRVINLPNTYPAKPIKGMLVSGFVSYELSKAAYPPFFAGKLLEVNYKLEADTNRGVKDLEYLLTELRQTLRSRLAALDILWPDLSWDLFIHVFTETDRLSHFFMDAVLNQKHPQHLHCMAFLTDWDQAIGQLLARYDALKEPKRLIVLADHGFTELKTEVCINTWLKQQQLLKLRQPPLNEWDATCIGSDSKAFALDPGRIYIHSRERFARGCVANTERSSLIKTIRAGLMDLTLDGERVMEYVHTGDELYPDATSEQLPDLVCQARPGYDLKAKFDRQDIFGHFGRTGTHTVEGAIFFDSEGSAPVRMRDIGRTIMEYFNISDN